MGKRTKGAVLLARRAFVTSEFGEESWERVLGTLSEEQREVLGGAVLAASWYPFELNQALDEAIGAELGGGGKKIFERMGAWSAKENLAGPHRAFLTPGDPMRFMGATDRIYAFYYESGYRRFEQTGPKSGLMTTYDAETYSKADCLTVVGWYKKALELCGARDVLMVEELCRARGNSVCRYRVSWESP